MKNFKFQISNFKGASRPNVGVFYDLLIESYLKFDFCYLNFISLGATNG